MNETLSSYYSLTAMDLMTERPISLTEKVTLREAARLFSENGISGAPVVNEEGKLIGSFSSTDFIRWMKDEQPHTVAAFDPFYRIEQSHDLPEEPIRKHMASFPVTVPPDLKLNAIARLMFEKHIHRVFIVDDNQRPQGVVTTMDILRVLSQGEQ